MKIEKYEWQNLRDIMTEQRVPCFVMLYKTIMERHGTFAAFTTTKKRE